MKEEYFKAETIEQTNLLTDPFGLTVLSILEEDKYMAAKDISEKSGEELELIEEYLELFLEEDMIERKTVDDKEIYAKKAEYYSFSPEVLSMIPDKIHDHFIFGLLHAIQGDYYDLLKLSKEYNDLESALEKAGYPEPKKSLDLIMGRIFIKEENINDMAEEINNIFKKYKEIPDGEDEEDYLSFDLNFLMKPTMSNFLKNIQDNS
ncbi:MAG: hypothetical protein K9K76_02735 [Halanaerobiales bacterium]|nr:hypothetical protein [Halanaerobiales bacterium]